MDHDVIDDQYARLFEIPRWLGKKGNEVHAYCLSYKRKQQGLLLNDHQTSWKSFNALPGFLFYTRLLSNDIATIQPDIVIGTSDLLNVILAWRLSKKNNIPFVADLYDNYECFGMSKTPILVSLYRKALRSANHVFTVSDALNKHVRSFADHGRVTTIESTINESQFYKVDKNKARKRINVAFNNDRIYLGLCGGLNKLRGIDSFIDGFVHARKFNNNLHLILAGNLDTRFPALGEGIEFIGRLEYSQMNDFYNAMDINAISMLENCFGKYAFPQKTYEIAATRTPCLVPDFGSVGKLFSSLKHSRYKAGNPLSISSTLLRLASDPEVPDIEIPTWEDQVREVHCELSKISV